MNYDLLKNICEHYPKILNIQELRRNNPKIEFQIDIVKRYFSYRFNQFVVSSESSIVSSEDSKKNFGKLQDRSNKVEYDLESYFDDDLQYVSIELNKDNQETVKTGDMFIWNLKQGTIYNFILLEDGSVCIDTVDYLEKEEKLTIKSCFYDERFISFLKESFYKEEDCIRKKGLLNFLIKRLNDYKPDTSCVSEYSVKKEINDCNYNVECYGEYKFHVNTSLLPINFEVDGDYLDYDDVCFYYFASRLRVVDIHFLNLNKLGFYSYPCKYNLTKMRLKNESKNDNFFS